MANHYVRSLLATSITIIVLTCALVTSRLWIRWRLHNTGLDDYLIAIAWLFLAAFCGLVIVASQGSALGHHWESSSDDKKESFMRYQTGISSTFSCAVALSKASFAVLYLRILPKRGLVILNKILICFLACQAIEETLLVILQCRPIVAAYRVDVEGDCLDLRVLWWSSFVFNLSTDLTLFIQPIPSVWGLQMAKAKRIGLVAMMSLGLLVCVISIIRIVYATRINSDVTYSITESIIWSGVEIAALIICSCIPSLRQIIQQIPWLDRALGMASSNKAHSEQYQYNQSKGQNKDGSIPLRGYSRHDYLQSSPRSKYRPGLPDEFGTRSEVMAGTAPSENDSTEEIFPHKTDGNGAILVTREVNHIVEYDEPQAHAPPAESVKKTDQTNYREVG